MRWTPAEIRETFWDQLMLWADEARAIYAETWGRLAPAEVIE